MDNRDFPQSNMRLGRPAGTSAEECHSLPVLRCGSEGSNEPDTFISCWQPTGAELARMNKGDPVWLSVWGDAHPPVLVTADPPFLTPEEAPTYKPRPRRIFVCSPLRGAMLQNQARAARYCREIAKSGMLPLAPHIYFTQFLVEEQEDERAAGCALGLELLRISDEVWVFTPPDTMRPSAGMQAEIDEAMRLGLPIKSGHHELDRINREQRLKAQPPTLG